MRFRIPPLFPPYAILVLVIAYAIGSLWLGLSRLDAITELTAANARNRPWRQVASLRTMKHAKFTHRPSERGGPKNGRGVLDLRQLRHFPSRWPSSWSSA